MLTALASLLLIHAQAAPVRHALVVGIKDYSGAGKDPKGDPFWVDLTGDEDAGQVRDTIVAIGRFTPDQVHVLSPRATKAEVVREFRTWLAAPGRAATKDDVFYFHFSGHGYRFNPKAVVGKVGTVTGTPLDGARTGLVFSDSNAGDPTRLLTNVEFESLLRPLEKANLTVTVDACHSGGGTRRGVLKVRGRVAPDVDEDAAAGDAPAAKDNGFFGEGFRPAYTALSACRTAQEALDTEHGGLFTVSYLAALRELAKESRETGKTPTYRELYDRTNDLMMRNPVCSGSQNPVIEGTADRELFGRGVLVPAAHYATTFNNRGLVVEGGLLFGLREGQHLDVYGTGHKPGDAMPKLATVKVESVTYNRAVVVPEGGAKAADLGGKWAFPGDDAVDPGTVGLALDETGLPAACKVAARGTFGAALAFLRTANHLAVRAAPSDKADLLLDLTMVGKVRLKDPAGHALGEFDADADPTLAERVRGFAKWRGISRLESPPDSDCPDFEMQIVPVAIRKAAVHEYVTAEKPLTPKLALDERFSVRIRSKRVGGFKPFLAILQLTPSRGVYQFWPPRSAATNSSEVPADGKWHWLKQDGGVVDGDVKLDTDDSKALGVWYYVDGTPPANDPDAYSDGVGPQTYKLFATKTFVDYFPILTRRGDSRAGGALALGTLIKTYSDGTARSASGSVPDVFSVSKLDTITVVKKG